jgi:hypothetical protein
MNFAKDFGGIGASYGNWQKYAGLGDKFAEEISAFPAPTQAVAPPGLDLPTDTEVKPVDYGIAPNKMPSGLGVAPANPFGASPTTNQGFSLSTKVPNLLDSVKQHYGVE